MTVLRSATITFPATDGKTLHALAERLLQIGAGGEVQVRPGQHEVVVTVLAEIPARERLTEAKLRDALPTGLREAAAIELGAMAAVTDEADDSGGETSAKGHAGASGSPPEKTTRGGGASFGPAPNRAVTARPPRSARKAPQAAGDANGGQQKTTKAGPAPNRAVTEISRAETERTWTLTTTDPTVEAALRKLVEWPDVVIERSRGGQGVTARFPAWWLRLKLHPAPGGGARVPTTTTLPKDRQRTSFRRVRGSATWEVVTTSPQVQKALLKCVDDSAAVTVKRRGDGLVFTVPADKVRISPAEGATRDGKAGAAR